MSHNETEVSCNHCKKIIFKSDKFCPYCGKKNEEIKQDNPIKKCVKCGELMGENDVFCGNCGHNQQIEKPVENVEEPIQARPIEINTSKLIKPKKKSKLALILVIVSLVIVVSVGAVYVYLENEKREAEIARLETLEREENERVNRALNDQLLYWSLEFASPSNDDTYTTFYPFDDVSDSNQMDQMCIVVGVTANKRPESKFALDDSIDGGLFDFELSEFTINDYTPLNSAQECGWNLDGYKIEYNDTFSLLSGESTLILFKMSLADLTSDSYNFMYKYLTITSLDTSTLDE